MGVIDSSASETETKKAVEKYVENKKGENPGKEAANGDQLTKDASDFLKKVKDAKADTKEKLNQPATGTPAATGPVKGGLNGKYQLLQRNKKTITVKFVKTKYSFYL